MKKIDSRSLPREAQQQNRYLAIKFRKEEGMSFVKIAKRLGVARQTVHNWYKKYKTEGYDSLILKKRGLKAGTNSKLTPEQIEILKQKIINNTPDQIGLFFSLWTLKSIRILIKNLWKIEVSPRTVCSYMRRLGFTPQKPIKQAYKRNPHAVRKWLDEDYPNIKKKLKKKKPKYIG